MTVTAVMVKELREKTGAGFMDSKKALEQCDGNIEKAMEFLRQKGIASAEKKQNRIAAEGLVATCIENGTGAIVEVNCETDFVAKNEDFKTFVNGLAKHIATVKPQNMEALNASVCPVCNMTIENAVKDKIATIGEKISIRRFEILEGDLATYVHNGKIGVLISASNQDETLLKDVALHIASSAPEFVSRAQIPQEVIEEETRIEMGKEDLAKKPENIRAKIVEGRVNKLMAQKCLLEQPFVKNPDQTVEQLLNGKLEIKSFIRWTLGEGLEKRQDNFAEEVMSQMVK
ncbi:MAG: translation elongation factor Ts [Candidatus Gastranaerophilales bacterium]|nr:translation elongation factor Ts [Candidatus Gastranaerophilales bacterium]